MPSHRKVRISIIAQIESLAACSTSAAGLPIATAASFALAATFSIVIKVGSSPALSSSSSATGQLARAQLGPCSRSLPMLSKSDPPSKSSTVESAACSPAKAGAQFRRWTPAFAGELRLQKRGEGRSQLRWARADRNSSRLHRGDLVFGAALAAATMAPAWPIRNAESGSAAMKQTVGLKRRRGSRGEEMAASPRPAPISRSDDRLRLRSAGTAQHSTKLVPLTGSPPIPTAVVWPRPALEVWNTAS